ncbi:MULTISPECIES: HAD family hydrolase [unclassified Streptomyces]|uniref:HAD family hydrolase n=1 Tax=unclassified Streptomyces TaxID=2593676 RepID=UPI0004C54CEE|nr:MULTISPECIES: HAD-IA family hydrolase [unclassified Streptomyces]
MVLGLPGAIRACLFDLDGVITDTAAVHAATWKETFDALLRQQEGDKFRPFTLETDYRELVDGRPRADGVRSFLFSRGIKLPEGGPDNPPGLDTVHGLELWKTGLFEERVRAEGVKVCQDTMDYVAAARERGVLTAVVTSNANCREILRAADAETLFDAWIDGLVAARRGLRGKPHPDTFLAAARDLGQHPLECAVFEDALAGMDAGRSGHFGWVIGVNRVSKPEALYAHGADTVVSDLACLIDAPDSWARS